MTDLWKNFELSFVEREKGTNESFCVYWSYLSPEALTAALNNGELVCDMGTKWLTYRGIAVAKIEFPYYGDIMDEMIAEKAFFVPKGGRPASFESASEQALGLQLPKEYGNEEYFVQDVKVKLSKYLDLVQEGLGKAAYGRLVREWSEIPNGIPDVMKVPIPGTESDFLDELRRMSGSSK